MSPQARRLVFLLVSGCSMAACGASSTSRGSGAEVNLQQPARDSESAGTVAAQPDSDKPDVALPPGSERAWVSFSGQRTLNLTVEVLRTQRQFDRGLMFRTTLPREAGVLFLFPESGDHVFWMKNVSMPLDIVFVDKDWKVVGVTHRAVPYSEADLSALKPSKYVVEMNAGLASEFGIDEGSRMRIELDRASCGCKEEE